MLLGVILIVKVNRKKKHAPFTAISLKKANLIEMTTQLISSLFFKKIEAVAVLPIYTDQTSVLPTAKFFPVLNQ